MMEQQNGSSYTEILYGPTGKLALMNGQSVTKAFISLTAGATAVYTAGPTLSYFRHPDWLGSSRFASTVSRTLYYSGAYAPFGETYAEAGTPDRSFTGQNQDTVQGSTAGLYDFLYRQYAQYGRWISPDPAGLGAVNPNFPQSWNRYAYVVNRAMNTVDPLGLVCGPHSIPNPDGGECWAEFPQDKNPSETSGPFSDFYNNFDGLLLVEHLEWVWLEKGWLVNGLTTEKLNTKHLTSWLAGRTPPNMNYKLTRIRDCFSPGDGKRTSTYSLSGPGGIVTSPDTVITEHQSNAALTVNGQGYSSEAGTIFQDWISPEGTGTSASSVRYFTVSSNGQDLGLVPVQYQNGAVYAYEGIWMYGDVQNPSNTQVFVNGSQADVMLTEGSCGD